MKKKIIIIGATLVMLVMAAVVVAGRGPHEAPIDWSARRGLDSYYSPDVLEYDLKDINVNLKGTDGQRYLWVGITVAYRVGQDVKEPKGVFAKGESDLRDRLTLLLSNKGISDLDSLEKKKVLKHEILEQVGAAIFPDKTGRVEDIRYRQFLFQ
jgi:flagellar basal body-associated protein FliL